jgi:hypothetical protein
VAASFLMAPPATDSAAAAMQAQSSAADGQARL